MYMANLGSRVGRLTWIIEIIAKRNLTIKYREQNRIKTKAGRVLLVHQNAISRKETKQSIEESEGIRTD